VDVGPLRVFISGHVSGIRWLRSDFHVFFLLTRFFFLQLIPSDMTYNPTANPPAYVSEDQTIEKGSRLRLKIVGVRADVGQMVAM
jgi:hypothetical protein